MDHPIKRTVAEQIFGANKAPVAEVVATDFAELFAEAEKLAAEVKARPTKIKDEADFGAVGAVATKVKALAKKLDETRLGETNPLRQAGIDIKAIFDARISALDAAFAPHQAAANTYTTEKAARDRRAREEEARKLREREEREREKAAETTGGTAARAEGRAEAIAAEAEKLEQGALSVADAVRTKTATGGSASARQTWDFSVADYADLDLNELREFFDPAAIDKAIRSKVRISKGATKLKGVKVFPKIEAQFRA